MAKLKTKTKPEAYIETRAGVRGGVAVIAGTGIKVLDVTLLAINPAATANPNRASDCCRRPA